MEIAGYSSSSSGSGLKLVLRVPKPMEYESTPSSNKQNSESSDNESDLEPLSEKVTKSENMEESDQNDDEDKTNTAKRRRRKKRFRLTTGSEKKRKKKTVPSVEPGESVVKSEDGPPEEEPEPEKISMPMPNRQRLLEYTPLQLLLDYQLRLFQKRDPEEYFMFPVTDEIAPDYSTIISQPRDFYTMRIKLDKNEYQSLAEFKEDVQLICDNALSYNDPTTVYYHAAKKLQILAADLFSQNKLVPLYKQLPFMPNVSADELGFDISHLVKQQHPNKKPRIISQYDCILDDVTAQDIVENAKKSASLAADKLAARKHSTHLTFIGQNEDGATVLNMLTPEMNLSQNEAKEKKRVRMYDLISKLKEGNPGLSPFTEDQANMVVPISYLDYGPYSSFAPQYDSTWATLTKQDSDLLLSTYGDKQTAQYAWSMRSFIKDSSHELVRMVDGLLDALTDGQHKRAVKALRQCDEEEDSTTDGNVANCDDTVDFDSLKSLQHLGFDVGFLDNLEKEFGNNTSKDVQNRLEQTGMLLSDLEQLQQERLSKQPEYTLTYTAGPTNQETELASSVVNNLKELIPSTSPANLVDEKGLHSAMGITNPNDDIDMDLLREFMDV